MMRGKHYFLPIFIMALIVGLVVPGSAATYNVTITATQVGTTAENIGVCEGCCGWNINDVVDLGAKNVRFWAGMSRVEPTDDDGIYGSPSIAQIKANPNLIPWSTWDTRFKNMDGYFWALDCAHMTNVSLFNQLTECKNNGVKPIVCLRNVDNNFKPDWAAQLNPPDTVEDWNEWWEFVFAWVYYANVINNLDINDWQSHNEPQNLSQGWQGTLADYIVFTQYTYDAIKYVYDTYLPGKTFRLYAPVSQNPKDEWLTQTLIQNDAIVDVVSANFYRPWNMTRDTLPVVHSRIATYNTDGILEPVHLGEWGHYNSSGYDGINYGIKWGEDLMWQSNCYDYPNSKGDISSIFSLYNWGTGMQGIISGVSPETGVKTDTYYAFRTIIRALQGGRPMYGQVESYSSQILNAKAPDGTLYVLIQAPNATTINLNVSAHRASGTAYFYEYSSANKDVLIRTTPFTGGALSFSMPRNSITCVKITP